MTKSRLFLFLQIGIVLACGILISCNGSNPVTSNPQQQSMNPAMNQMATTANATTSPSVATQQTNTPSGDHGSFTQIPAYYDSRLLTINFQELPPRGEKQALSNPGLNFIYQCDACEGTLDFISVIDAEPTDGMNPLWEEVQITFLTIPPQQFFSDDEILQAYALGEIDLTHTGEVYTCSVIKGAK